MPFKVKINVALGEQIYQKIGSERVNVSCMKQQMKNYIMNVSKWHIKFIYQSLFETTAVKEWYNHKLMNELNHAKLILFEIA